MVNIFLILFSKKHISYANALLKSYQKSQKALKVLAKRNEMECSFLFNLVDSFGSFISVVVSRIQTNCVDFTNQTVYSQLSLKKESVKETSRERNQKKPMDQL